MALRLGRHGDDVKELQILLSKKDFYLGAYDGDFGPKTETAVKAFQSSTGISVDGIAGRMTMHLLKTLKKLKFLFVHCSDTPEGKYFDGEDIIAWHTDPKPRGNGWSKPGYSQVVLLDGNIDELQSFNDDMWVNSGEITYGAAGMNSISRHICYIGGRTADNKSAKDTRTRYQKSTLADIISINILQHPDIMICGHYHFHDTKKCPSFDVEKWLEELGVKENNIYRPGKSF